MAAAPRRKRRQRQCERRKPIATSTSRLRVSGENVIVGNRRKRPLTCGFLRVPQYTINVLAVERGSPAGGRPDATRLLRLHRRDLGRFGVGCARRRRGRPGRAACASGDAAARAVRARVRGGRRARGASGPRRGTDLGHHRGDPDVLERSGAARRIRPAAGRPAPRAPDLPSLRRGRGPRPTAGHRDGDLPRARRSGRDRRRRRDGARPHDARGRTGLLLGGPDGPRDGAFRARGHADPSATVVELLRGAPVFSAGVSAELTTATGAAILAATVEGYGEIPALRIEEAGYGAGSARLDFPNVTRVLVGMEEPASSLPSVPGVPELRLVPEPREPDDPGRPADPARDRLPLQDRPMVTRRFDAPVPRGCGSSSTCHTLRCNTHVFEEDQDEERRRRPTSRVQRRSACHRLPASDGNVPRRRVR